MKKKLLTSVTHSTINRKCCFTLVFFLTVLFISLSATADESLLTPEQQILVTENTVWYSFTPTTPEESGTYVFCSRGNVDTVGYLYQVNSSGDIVGDIINDDNSGEDENFKIICNLTLGSKYIFGATLASDASSDSFYVLLSKNDWSFQNGVLTISGTNPMPEYVGGDTPWYDYKDQITSIVLKNGVPNIGPYAFTEYQALTSVTVPSSVTDIGEYAFFGCSSLSKITISSGLTNVGNYAFADCISLKNVTLPDTVDYINDGAFSGCMNLTSLTVPDSVHFRTSNVLPSVPEGKQHPLADSNGYIVLGHLLAGYTGSVSNIEATSFPSGIHVIGDYAFHDNQTLLSVDIPDGVTAIGDKAFENCQKLKSIQIPDSVISISASAFTNCTSLDIEEINGFMIIQNYLYKYNGSGSNVIIPNGVTTIGNFVFANNNEIKSVTFPSTLTTVGDYAFNGCTSLKQIEPVTDPSPSYYFCRFGGLYEFSLPHFVKEFGENSFTDTALGEPVQPTFVIPENFDGMVIEEEAFQGIAATYVVVPASISSISSGTFASCTELRFIYFSNPDCAIADDAFTGCNSSLTFICQENGEDGITNVHHFADTHHFQFIKDEGF